MNNMLDAALAYAERGLPIFPCTPAKAPLTPNGCLDATTNPEHVREFWETWPNANIGLNAGAANLMVLDLDPGHDLGALDAAVGGLPPTLMRQRTPRGGEHLFYALGAGEIVAPSASKLSPHVDVRSLNSYVLLAPSVTADGTYSWESEGTPAYRTDEMIRVANSGREKSATRAEWIIKPDLPENIALAEAWLAKDAKIATEGQGGDHAAYATAAMCRSFGLSEEAALDCMWRVWNPRCDPPWSDMDYLETKVRNGYAYCTSDPGNLTDAYRAAKVAALFKPVAAHIELAPAAEPDAGLSGTAGRFRFADRRAMQSIEPPTWLIDGFIPEGAYALMVAPPRSLKSFVALDIALTICAGICDAPVWSAMSSGSVLYMAGEGRSQLTKRVAAWEAEHYSGAEVEGFILADPIPNVLVDDDWTSFIAGAKGMQPGGYKLAVLDTAGRAMQGVSEDKQETASKLTQRVEQLQRELGCAVLVIHHSGHSGTRARGSSVFGADADVVVVLEREGQAMDVALRMEKQKDAPEWERPKRVAVREINLGNDTKSLAAVAHVMKPGDAAEPNRRAVANVEEAKSLFSNKRWHDPEFQAMVDNAVREALASNKAMEWTANKLADVMAHRDDMAGVSAQAIRKSGLGVLKEKPGTYTRRAYDPLKGKWRFYAE